MIEHLIEFAFFDLRVEFDTAQFVTAQSIHAGAERRHGQVFLVDDQSGRQAGQISAPSRHFHGDVQVREEARTCQKEGNNRILVSQSINLIFINQYLKEEDKKKLRHKSLADVSTINYSHARE